LSDFNGPCEKTTVQIKNVALNGYTVTMFYPAVTGNLNVSGTWIFQGIGKE
jgi:hypothetical protein